MQKLQLVETKAIKDGVIANPTTAYDISLEKGVGSAINTLISRIHQLGTDFNLNKGTGMSVLYTVRIDGEDTHIKIGPRVGLVIKEKKEEAWLKEAGLKKLTLSDFTQDYPAFRQLFEAIAGVVKYHIGTYLSPEQRAEIYKDTAAKYFNVQLEEGRADEVSWSVQTKAQTEKYLYGLADLITAAKAENSDDYMENKRASASRSIAWKEEQRALAKAERKMLTGK